MSFTNWGNAPQKQRVSLAYVAAVLVSIVIAAGFGLWSVPSGGFNLQRSIGLLLQHPAVAQRAGDVFLAAAAFNLLCVLFIKTILLNSSRANEGVHGSARWANATDIERAGLFSDEGVYVGAWADKKGRVHYLRHSGPEHVLCYAPTRSGKGVGLVVPTLLSWSQSAVITDLKGELWALTSGWRQKHAGNKVLRFEPGSLNSGVRFNPLEEIRLGSEQEVGDVQNLATLLVDPDGRGLNDHWQKTAQAVLVGCILHLLYRAKNEALPANFADLDAMLSDPNRAIAELWMEMTQYQHLGDKPHPVVAASARDMMDRPDDEAGSVLSTAKSYLALYRDPVVAANTCRSDFKVHDLMHHQLPVSLYIVTQPTDKNRLRPLVRVVVNLILRLLADRMDFENGQPKAHYRHRLLAMLDEFPSLGRLEIMQESLAFIAGYGIKCYLITQDINQLQNSTSGYGREESITSNCHIQIAFPPNRLETAEHLSRLTGQTTVVKEHVTTSGKRISPMHVQVSRTLQETQRALLTADECLRMQGPLKNRDGLITEAGHMVIYAAGFPAIYGRQPLYFKDPIFLKRAAIAAPQMSDRLKHEDLSEPVPL